jgi:hypothetical protein
MWHRTGPSLPPGESRSPPSIVLVGPSILTVPYGYNYAACPTSAALSISCDRGATASDAVDGDLTLRVLACATAEEVRPV